MNLYGVFFNESSRETAMWALLRNKRDAIRAARFHKGYVLVHRDVYGSGAWDAPTFKVSADLLADFRERKG